eukprot:CAMPEP_0203969728 /NCGR_PEP_ID=MMETSP0359-20131031/97603_1 /ASSEMBLY_ACC=CAM_ASM_000338 /TAXON_ID=268821 /ORGANISM="Scrippsiella Hangoei, Strain SHTV-5" /LENGTH=432 /DNA_ID=CAMNT_0050907669 /DNA_START=42 /DNA_END=1338 /DNA_ORIENTATION=-
MALSGRTLLLLCLCVGHLLQAHAKLQRSTLRLGRDTRRSAEWQYVGKFGFAIGQGTYEARLKETVPGSLPLGTSLQLEVYIDEDWPHVETMTEVCRKKERSRRTRDIAIGSEAGEWGPLAKGSIAQNVRPHVWYFAISDCRGTLKNGTYGLDFEIEFKQDGGSHFSVELQWATSANLLTLLGCSAFLWSFCRRSRSFLQRTGSLHPVIWSLGGVVILQYLAQCLHTGHLAIYRSDGQGSRGMELLSEVLFVLCQVIQSSLLVTIGMGYTLLQAKLHNTGLVLPICGLVALVHVLLVILDKAQSEASHRFTDHDGSTGWIFFGLRLALYAWFLRAANGTARQGGLKLQAFIAKFRLAASLYFLAYPGTFLVMLLFAPYLREPVMESGLMVAQVISNVWLASLFLDRGAYFEASSLSASPLPGGGTPTFFKQEE